MLLANAVGLIVASLVLSGFSIDVTAFIIAVVIFTVVLALMLPFLASMLRRGGSSALGGVALIATLVSLIITSLISDGFSIDGIGTWIAAAAFRSSTRTSFSQRFMIPAVPMLAATTSSFARTRRRSSP